MSLTKIKKQILKVARYKLQITKEVSNTVFINSNDEIYKEIILHSKHIILT
jgi:hypothetical protein